MPPRTVLILHDSVPSHAPPEAQDTLAQVAAVQAALAARSFAAETVAVTADLDALRRLLGATRPMLVFNLVESLAGSDAGMVAITALLDGLGVAYTGSPTAACALANDKPAAKALMRRLGMPTPVWFTSAGEIGSDFDPGRYVVKSRFEHASAGLDEESLACWHDAQTARAQFQARHALLGRPCFAEAFIDGREFNVALLAAAHGPVALPPAEIDFSAFPPGKPRLVGYRAKWLEDSFEYRHTPRRFEFPPDDAALLDSLRMLARRAYAAFGLRGYARVDFRVDADGPWILELNANPCLAPDAGFAAALARAGIDFTDAIDRIIADALGDWTCDVPHTPHS
jgi:D-alanine-D-alanine ligase